jgi:hypothetical protein
MPRLYRERRTSVFVYFANSMFPGLIFVGRKNHALDAASKLFFDRQIASPCVFCRPRNRSEYIMIANRDIRSDYSADVRLQPEAQGQVWPLAKIGRDRIVPSEAIELPPCDAVVVMTVDGSERRWSVRLVDGASPLDTDVRTRPR